MTWKPQSESVVQLQHVLAQSISSSNTIRAEARRALEDAKKQPDLANYLVYLLVTPESGADTELRATAGILLKNDVRTGYRLLDSAVQGYIKSECVKGLLDQSSLVRNITGNVITTLLSQAGIMGWPEILPQLMSMTETDDIHAQEGAMSALSKICEDSASDLDKEYNGQRPLKYMISKFLSLTHSGSSKVRSLSIFCLTQFIILQSQSLLIHLDEVLNSLFALASDPDPDTRRNICGAFASLLEVRPDKLLPHLEGVINYSLHCIKDEDEQVAAEGCEFILGLAESTSIDPQYVQFHLPAILPVILSTMVYSEMDRFMMESIQEEDDEVEDRPEDIRPTNVKSKDAHTADKKDAKKVNHNDGNNEEDGDEEDDEDSLEMSLQEWNLRKCSAAALDVFAGKFPEICLEIALPYLRENIVSNDWYVREASILAFGAIAEGCVDMVEQHLHSLIPFLVDRLNDKEVAVRQISCWTLGRYSDWIVSQSKGGNHEKFFLPVLQNLLKCCLDKNKKVQESGCSAFATFTEAAGEELIPYLEAILQHLALSCRKYQAKNLIILYDAIQTLIDRLPASLSEDKYVNIIVPPLMEKWNQYKDSEQGLWPLMECLSSVTAAIGDFFIPFAPTVFERCINILRDNLTQDQHHQVDPSIEAPERDFIITALDLIDGLIQGLGSKMSELIARAQPPLMEMLIVCFKDPVYEVRQSAFALVGDMTILCYDAVNPYFEGVVKELIPQIDVSDYAAGPACNNAMWSLGELSLRSERRLERYIPEVLQRLVSVLQSNSSSTLLENAAIAIGRIGINLPELISPHVSLFIDRWCESMRDVDETDEKDSAMRGMCHIVASNPAALSNEASLVSFIETLALYLEPSPQLGMLIAKVLEGYKSYVSNWDVVMTKLSPGIADSLRLRYGL